jgi:hypothetical protein
VLLMLALAQQAPDGTRGPVAAPLLRTLQGYFDTF